MSRLFNPTKAPRVVYDENMTPVTVPPFGYSKDGIKLSKEITKELNERNQRNPDSDLFILNDGQSVKDARRASFEPAPQDDQTSANAGDQDTGGDTAGDREAAQGLVAVANDIPFNEFKDRARSILGEQFPGGQPSKRELIDLLNNVQ